MQSIISLQSSVSVSSHIYYRLRHRKQIDPLHIHAKPLQSALPRGRTRDVPDVESKGCISTTGNPLTFNNSTSASARFPGLPSREERSPARWTSRARPHARDLTGKFPLTNSDSALMDQQHQNAAQPIHLIGGQQDYCEKACISNLTRVS